MKIFNIYLVLLLSTLTFAQNSIFYPTRINYKVGGLPWGVVCADFNNDGNPDVATCSRQERSVTILFGRGDGSFDNRADYDVGISPRSLVAVDFNNDNNIDIATANLLSNDITVLLGNGDGTFQDSTNYPSGSATRFIISDDFNNDNIPDLAAANRDGNSISIFIGRGDGTFNSAQYIIVPTSFNPRQITSADFNNDNIADVIAVHDDQSGFPYPRAVYFNGTGNGTFGTGVELTLAVQGLFSESVSVANGDFNNDNNMDLIIGMDESNTGYLNIFLGNGDGTFQIPEIFSVYRGPFAINITDINNDDKADMICIDANLKAVSVHLGNGNGTFTNELPPDPFDKPNHFIVGQYPRFLTSADVNKDQKKDIIVAIEDAGEISILLGKGDSAFVIASEYRTGIPPQAFPMDGLSWDFNNDGNNDLAVANWGYPNDTSVVTILYGNGDSTFPDSINYLCGINPRNVVSGDFNNDNIIDLAVANDRDTVISVLFGNQTGSFFPALAVSIAHDPNLTLPVYPDLTVADFNKDNNDDIAVVNYNQNKVHLLFGSGSGGFSTPLFLFTPVKPQSIKSADFNNDLNPDLAVLSAEFSGSNSISIITGDGSGGFAQPIIIPIAATHIYQFDLAYLDNDEFIDMMVVEGEENKIFIFSGNGDGNFTLINTIDVFEPDAVSGVDLNSDNNIDLAITSGSNSELLVYFGDGSFNFTKLEESFGVQGGGHRIIQSDFDNDNDIDFAVTKGIFGYGSVSILLNQTNVTSIDYDNEYNAVPNEFKLFQNFPNPFNPITTIHFQVPNSSFINLKVYDILGNEIATLVNEEKPAGSYEVDFNAAGLSSGIYFYQIKANSFVQTKKMILMK